MVIRDGSPRFLFFGEIFFKLSSKNNTEKSTPAFLRFSGDLAHYSISGVMVGQLFFSGDARKKKNIFSRHGAKKSKFLFAT